MLLSMYTLRDTMTRLDSLVSKIKENTSEELLDTYKAKTYAILYDMLLGVGELIHTVGDRDWERKFDIILDTVNEIVMVESFNEYKAEVNKITTLFKDIDYENVGDMFNSSAYAFKIACDDEQKYYHNTRTLRDIIDSIESKQNRVVNVFSPDCYDADISSLFNDIKNSEVRVYGNEASHAISYAKNRLYKVVKGPFRGSKISNEVFDIAYIYPRISFDAPMERIGFATKRPEKTYINEMFKYVRKGGLVVVTLPFYRLYKDVCTMFAKQLRDIRIISVDGLDYSELGLVHIIGYRDPSKEMRMDEYTKLRNSFNYQEIFNRRTIGEYKYSLPSGELFIDLFKGSVLDMDEVQNIFDTSNLMNDVWDSQKVTKMDEEIRNPLLPFNIGQLGLVLTSGCLDGVIDEGNGYHLIKGRVSKKRIVEETDEDDVIVVSETITNKVEINVLLPNGEYKLLA